MLYPVYIHKDKESAYGLSFPDFDGCISAADEWVDVPRMAQEAVELHFEGEHFKIPHASKPDDWLDDERYQGGFWLLLEIDLGKLNSKTVRINISMSEKLVLEVDAMAKSRHQSRSAFLAAGAEKLLHQMSV